MTTIKMWLSGILSVQLLLALGIYFMNAKPADFQGDQPFVAFATDDVTRLRIDGSDSHVLIEKTGTHWTLPNLEGVKASEKKITKVLENLSEVKSGWPVAQSHASHTRFDVSDDKFQRKISLFNGEKTLSTIYLGTSPGYRSAHARKEGDDAIFSVRLANHEFPAEAKAWLDKAQLSLESYDAVMTDSFSLVKEGKVWKLGEGMADDATQDAAQAASALNEERVEEFANAFRTLRVLDVADSTISDAESTLTFTVKSAGETLTYTFARSGDHYLVSRSDTDTVFTVPEFRYNALAEVNLAYLTQNNSDEAEGAAATTQDLSLYSP